MKFLIVLVAVILGCNHHESPKPSSLENSPQPSEQKSAQRQSGDKSFATPPTSTPAQPTTETRQPPTFVSQAEQDKLNAQIKQTFTPTCHFERACDSLIGVDCNAAVDGPYYYVERYTLKVVARCGGYCMSGKCENCPPSTWTCTTY